jgi:hypothetical protein
MSRIDPPGSPKQSTSAKGNAMLVHSINIDDAHFVGL